MTYQEYVHKMKAYRVTITAQDITSGETETASKILPYPIGMAEVRSHLLPHGYVLLTVHNEKLA